jgi:hypothetical protein
MRGSSLVIFMVIVNAGVSEIIAHTALNIFTNYFNNAVSVVVDFPEVELVGAAYPFFKTLL